MHYVVTAQNILSTCVGCRIGYCRGFPGLETINRLDVVDQSDDIAGEHQEKPDDAQNTKTIQSDESVLNAVRLTLWS
jgi:hypothetical protein